MAAILERCNGSGGPGGEFDDRRQRRRCFCGRRNSSNTPSPETSPGMPRSGEAPGYRWRSEQNGKREARYQRGGHDGHWPSVENYTSSFAPKVPSFFILVGVIKFYF